VIGAYSVFFLSRPSLVVNRAMLAVCGSTARTRRCAHIWGLGCCAVYARGNSSPGNSDHGSDMSAPAGTRTDCPAISATFRFLTLGKIPPRPVFYLSFSPGRLLRFQPTPFCFRFPLHNDLQLDFFFCVFPRSLAGPEDLIC